jgi:hypothetical protein
MRTPVLLVLVMPRICGLWDEVSRNRAGFPWYVEAAGFP